VLATITSGLESFPPADLSFPPAGVSFPVELVAAARGLASFPAVRVSFPAAVVARGRDLRASLHPA